MTDFPCHLFKVPGPHMRLGVKYRYIGCTDQKDFDRLTAGGWFETIEEAKAGKSKPTAENDDAAPTRAELEQKATELGIKFDGRTADKTLAKKIEEAL